MLTDEEYAKFNSMQDVADRLFDGFDIQKVVNASVAVGDTFSMDVLPHVGWFKRVLIRLRLVAPPKPVPTFFTVTSTLTG